MTAWHRGDDWTLRAKRRGMEDALFPEASDQKRAKAVCPDVQFDWNASSSAGPSDRVGCWGGMTERAAAAAPALRRCRGAHPYRQQDANAPKRLEIGDVAR